MLLPFAYRTSVSISRRSLKTAMGAAEHVLLGDEEAASSTHQTVIDLKKKGYRVFGLETTENVTSLLEKLIQDDDTESTAYVFGNELITVDVQFLCECDGVVCLVIHDIDSLRRRYIKK